MGWDVTDGKQEDGDVNVAFDVVESWGYLRFGRGGDFH